MEKPYTIKKDDNLISYVFFSKKSSPIIACVSENQAIEIVNLLNNAYNYGKIEGISECVEK